LLAIGQKQVIPIGIAEKSKTIQRAIVILISLHLTATVGTCFLPTANKLLQFIKVLRICQGCTAGCIEHISWPLREQWHARSGSHISSSAWNCKTTCCECRRQRSPAWPTTTRLQRSICTGERFLAADTSLCRLPRCTQSPIWFTYLSKTASGFQWWTIPYFTIFYLKKKPLVTINVQQRNYGGRTAQNRIKRVENSLIFGENFEKLFNSIQKSHFVRKIPKNSSFSLKHIPQHPNRPLEGRKFPHLISPVPTVCMLVTDPRSFRCKQQDLHGMMTFEVVLR